MRLPYSFLTSHLSFLKKIVSLQKIGNMWSKRLFIFIFMVCLLLFSCEKYEGTISGTVALMENGVVYPLEEEVIVTKIQLKGKKEIVVATEKSDARGNFVFNHTAKGSWKINGRLEIEDLLFEGSSEEIVIDETSKEKKITLVLLPIERE